MDKDTIISIRDDYEGISFIGEVPTDIRNTKSRRHSVTDKKKYANLLLFFVSLTTIVAIIFCALQFSDSYKMSDNMNGTNMNETNMNGTLLFAEDNTAINIIELGYNDSSRNITENVSYNVTERYGTDVIQMQEHETTNDNVDFYDEDSKVSDYDFVDINDKNTTTESDNLVATTTNQSDMNEYEVCIEDLCTTESTNNIEIVYLDGTTTVAEMTTSNSKSNSFSNDKNNLNPYRGHF